jgi:hypothetical protein
LGDDGDGLDGGGDDGDDANDDGSDGDIPFVTVARGWCVVVSSMVGGES